MPYWRALTYFVDFYDNHRFKTKNQNDIQGEIKIEIYYKELIKAQEIRLEKKYFYRLLDCYIENKYPLSLVDILRTFRSSN